MSVHPQSGYMLPDGFNVVSTIFEKIVAQRHISRHSDEADCLARYALECYMGGTRDARDLELRLQDACRSHFQPRPRVTSKTELADMLPELLAHARHLTATPNEARALAEETLHYALRHIDQLNPGSSLRAWLVGVMMKCRFGRLNGSP